MGPDLTFFLQDEQTKELIGFCIEQAKVTPTWMLGLGSALSSICYSPILLYNGGQYQTL
jgi:hypothetical protein